MSEFRPRFKETWPSRYKGPKIISLIGWFILIVIMTFAAIVAVMYVMNAPLL